MPSYILFDRNIIWRYSQMNIFCIFSAASKMEKAIPKPKRKIPKSAIFFFGTIGSIIFYYSKIAPIFKKNRYERNEAIADEIFQMELKMKENKDVN